MSLSTKEEGAELIHAIIARPSPIHVVRIVEMSEPTREINRIGFGTTLLRRPGNTPVVHDNRIVLNGVPFTVRFRSVSGAAALLARAIVEHDEFKANWAKAEAMKEPLSCIVGFHRIYRVDDFAGVRMLTIDVAFAHEEKREVATAPESVA